MERRYNPDKAQRDRLAAGVEQYIEEGTWDNQGVVNTLLAVGIDTWHMSREYRIEELKDGLFHYGDHVPLWQYVVMEYELWRTQDG